MAASDEPTTRRPWDQLPGEPRTAYLRFRAYLNLGPGRSFPELAKALNKKPSYRSTIAEWSRRWGWVDRCSAWDDHQLATAMEGREQALEQARQRAFDQLGDHLQLLEGIARGIMPPGDQEVLLDRQGRPLEATIRHADGTEEKVPITRPVIRPTTRRSALITLIGFGGLVVAKRSELKIDGADEMRRRALQAAALLDLDAIKALASAFGLEDPSL